MTKQQFRQLVDMLHCRLVKQDTNMHHSFKPDERCCLALQFLATGKSFSSLQLQFRFGWQTVSKSILDVCEGIYEELGPVFFKKPKSRTEWEEIAAKFETRWNLPNVLGAIDGKRIILEQPNNSSLKYHDYKGADGIIINVDVGMNGRMSDGGNWNRNSFHKAMEVIHSKFPHPLPGRSMSIPHVFVRDDGIWTDFVFDEALSTN